MARRPTVLLLMPHLGGGGAERVMALLAGGLSDRKYDLHVGLICRDEDQTERLPSSVSVHCLKASRVRGGAVGLIRLVRRVKPDLILSGIAHLNFLVLMLRPLFRRGVRILVRQNGACGARTQYPKCFNRFLYRALYPTADGIICQTRAMRDELTELIGRRVEIGVLPNPIDIEEMRLRGIASSIETVGIFPHLVAVGRLVLEKGFDMLLESFAALRLEYADAHLLILGEGPKEGPLKQLCRELGMEDAVSFAGHVLHPESYFGAASVFVLPSREEGLPNALLEAAACGLPIVALPCSQGLVELVRGKKGVWLAGGISTAALTDSLRAAIRSLRPRERFEHSWVEAFRMETSIVAYESMIDRALGSELS